MGSCFPFLSGEDNAHKLALLSPMDSPSHKHTHGEGHLITDAADRSKKQSLMRHREPRRRGFRREVE